MAKKRFSYQLCYALAFVLLMYYSIGDIRRVEGERVPGSVVSCRCYLCETCNQNELWALEATGKG